MMTSHAKDIKETLETLKKYGMNLNPTKCMFGVREENILGFYVGKVEINPNLEKSKQL